MRRQAHRQSRTQRWTCMSAQRLDLCSGPLNGSKHLRGDCAAAKPRNLPLSVVTRNASPGLSWMATGEGQTVADLSPWRGRSSLTVPAAARRSPQPSASGATSAWASRRAFRARHWEHPLRPHRHREHPSPVSGHGAFLLGGAAFGGAPAFGGAFARPIGGGPGAGMAGDGFGKPPAAPAAFGLGGLAFPRTFGGGLALCGPWAFGLP